MVYEVKLEKGWDSLLEKKGGIIVNWKYGQLIAYPIMPYGMFAIPSSDVIEKEGNNISAYVTFIENKNRLHFLGFRVYNQDNDVIDNYGKRHIFYSPDWLIIMDAEGDNGIAKFSISDKKRDFIFSVEINKNAKTTDFKIDDKNNKVKVEAKSNKLSLEYSGAVPTPSKIELEGGGVKVDGKYVLFDSAWQHLQNVLTNIVTAFITTNTAFTSLGLSNVLSGDITTLTTDIAQMNQTIPDQYYSKK